MSAEKLTEAEALNEAVLRIEESRQTHIEWLDYWNRFEAHACTTEPCPWEAAREATAAIAGGADHQRECIRGYDTVLTVLRGVAERVAREREAVLDEAGYAKRKRDEFSADRRDQIIEALSWWEDDSGRWGYDRAETVLRAHEIEWSGDLRATTQDGEAT